MRILQLDVDRITYEPVKPEASVYEDVSRERISVEDTLVILVSIETGDTKEMAEKAMHDTFDYMEKLARKKLVIYPFAHLSRELADPHEAMNMLNYMYSMVPGSIEAKKAPFGWNKKLILDIKVHPLAEQSRTYGAGEEAKIYKKAKPVSANTAIVRKSDWSGMPPTDHRTIGEKLDLYSFQEVSPSMVYWHPNGHLLFRNLMQYLREKEEEHGYKEIGTPVVANTALWHVSGHIDHYKENMFIFNSGTEELGLKPMNCPSTILIYKSRKWSYRDLPFRTAIFDKLYRREVSGALTGLFRVQELTQDDGHVFLREDQLEEEIEDLLKMVKEVYDTFEMRFIANLSTMPDNHMGDERLWEQATDALKKALEKNRIEYKVKEKEGAFYGPKIDIDVLDALGRSWQCATIQVDYQQPIRFKLSYTGEDGHEKMPVIIHRAILGSLERFIAILVEHYQGKFPAWLSPVQVNVLSISEQTSEYAKSVYDELKKNRIRAGLDISDRTLEYKIRESISMKVPYTIVLGKKEKEAGKIAVRNRDGVQKFGVDLHDFAGSLAKEISERSNTLSLP
ncbi:MAG: threonine--tRNA ligase [Candidatus Marsarchaeota archaeon]|nr:threonine--tRNA ligase [Candidatus Marsarchaeota archaeon]